MQPWRHLQFRQGWQGIPRRRRHGECQASNLVEDVSGLVETCQDVVRRALAVFADWAPRQGECYGRRNDWCRRRNASRTRCWILKDTALDLRSAPKNYYPSSVGEFNGSCCCLLSMSHGPPKPWSLLESKTAGGWAAADQWSEDIRHEELVTKASGANRWQSWGPQRVCFSWPL